MIVIAQGQSPERKKKRSGNLTETFEQVSEIVATFLPESWNESYVTVL